MEEQAIPVLRVANAADSVAWYERLGFRSGSMSRDYVTWSVMAARSPGSR